jgi:hypothetical protein
MLAYLEDLSDELTAPLDALDQAIFMNELVQLAWVIGRVRAKEHLVPSPKPLQFRVIAVRFPV